MNDRNIFNACWVVYSEQSVFVSRVSFWMSLCKLIYTSDIFQRKPKIKGTQHLANIFYGNNFYYVHITLELSTNMH